MIRKDRSESGFFTNFILSIFMIVIKLRRLWYLGSNFMVLKIYQNIKHIFNRKNKICPSDGSTGCICQMDCLISTKKNTNRTIDDSVYSRLILNLLFILNHRPTKMQHSKDDMDLKCEAEIQNSGSPRTNGNYLILNNSYKKCETIWASRIAPPTKPEEVGHIMKEEPIICQQNINGSLSEKMFSVLDNSESLIKNTVPDTEISQNCRDYKAIMRQLVLEKHQYSWRAIAKVLGWTKQKAIDFWQQEVYPEIKLDTKVAGALKWSIDEDSIMTGYIKKIGFNWNELVKFLPGRTLHSAQGRRRRLMKRHGVDEVYIHKLESQFTEPIQYMNKHQFRKHVIKQIAKKAALKAQETSNVVLFEDEC